MFVPGVLAGKGGAWGRGASTRESSFLWCNASRKTWRKGVEGTGDIFLPSVSPTTSSTFCLKPNPQFVDNLHFLLSLIFLCFQKSTVVTMRETWKCTYSTGHNLFTIFSQCLISQKSSFQRRIKNNITIIVLPFLHVALLFDWLETTAGIIKTTCRPCICKGYM